VVGDLVLAVLSLLPIDTDLAFFALFAAVAHGSSYFLYPRMCVLNTRCSDGAAADSLRLPWVRRYLTFMKTTVSSKGQIVLPAEFRQMDRIEPGQEFDVERLDRGDYRFVRRAARQNEGAIDWLLACPVKDFFVPIDSESTDEL
jgi:AbrB family looped-hinge helix DNA binding protein